MVIICVSQCVYTEFGLLVYVFRVVSSQFLFGLPGVCTFFVCLVLPGHSGTLVFALPGVSRFVFLLVLPSARQ